MTEQTLTSKELLEEALKAVVAPALSTAGLLDGLVANVSDIESPLQAMVYQDVTELNVTVNFKTKDGVKGTILADYNEEQGLSVRERYGSVARYESLCTAFQAEVDHFDNGRTNE